MWVGVGMGSEVQYDLLIMEFSLQTLVVRLRLFLNCR